MDSSTWILIAAIAAAVLIVLVVIAVAVRRRGAPARDERKRMEARQHRREAELKAAEADRMEAEARLQAAQAERKSAIADATKADARREAVLAEDSHHEAEAVAREAAETMSMADRMDPGLGKGEHTPSRDADRWDTDSAETADTTEPADTARDGERPAAEDAGATEVRTIPVGTTEGGAPDERGDDVPVGTRSEGRRSASEGNEV